MCIYPIFDCLFSSLRASSRSGSEPFTHVYTTSIGNSGQRLGVDMTVGKGEGEDVTMREDSRGG